MVGLLKPEFVEVVTGEAEVREIFRVPKVGAIAGCYVRNGVITRGSKVRFLREGVVIWTGAIQSLKRFKDDAREVATGFECGIGLTDFQDLRRGDIIETYEEREVPRRGGCMPPSTSPTAGRSRRSGRLSSRWSRGCASASRCRWPRWATRTSGSALS
jgi:hypothetical protein